jgi:hypothetical protein
MRTVSFSTRRTLIGAVAGLVLALAAPAVALAANTASFGNLVPAKDSVLTTARSAVSVRVYDRYGVRGTGAYSMSIDDGAVRPDLAYVTPSGDYRIFNLSYTVPTTLTVGTHKVTVRVRDLRRRDSIYSWSFKVLAPIPPPQPPVDVEMPVTIASTSCASCHVGIVAVHPMTKCESCHGANAPVGEPAYTSADTSAHTLGCSFEAPCHGGGGSFPHVLWTDCTKCHSDAYPSIPKYHGAASAADHTSTSVFCTKSGCHSSSLTIEHYKRTANGAPLSCGTCHNSTDGAVIKAISSRTTACESCHDFSDASHPGTATPHAPPVVACTAVGCHSAADVAAIHKGACAACHVTGRTPSTDCSTCHPAQPHTRLSTVHAAPVVDCTASDCHGSDAMTIHLARGPLACQTCHAPGATKTVVCATCHAGGASAAHAKGTISHAITGDCAIAGCHVSDPARAADVTVIHAPGPSCKACHASGKTPSTTCSTCHAADTFHAGVTQLHALPAGMANCAVAGCHSVDVAQIHKERGFGCATCHAPGKNPSTDCSTCHTNVGHTTLADKHTTASTCAQGGFCHVTNVLTVHKNKCVACHAPGKTPSTDCSKCHAPAAIHVPAATAHTVISGGCAVNSCHLSNVTAIHARVGCLVCHGPGKTPSTACADCHATPHAQVVVPHTAPGTACISSQCHVTNVLTIHRSNCSACHAPGKVPSTNCFSCHADAHSAEDVSHVITDSCASTGCHQGTAETIHKGSCVCCHFQSRAASLACLDCHKPHVPAR